ncbi:hypothetical protein G3480_26105 [Thiorhodococcus mannitoliphagus]|uniref:Uncharacterized protein n=2 Tax=Thiorhodococcus mannitoliphagus TaxID=329406 RepID=A0A6P1E1N8_9GAMM|nr:hypothetical protein [Thiorhodococcus mannitoliphagus]
MDYNHILEALNEASLFELYRLNVAIANQLDDPARIRNAKQALCVGQTVSWFDSGQNRLVEAHLLKINRTRAVVKNIGDGRRWTIPFYLINLDGQDAEIASTKRRGLDRNSVKVGDRVAFKDRNGHENFGEVVKLNQKSAAVLVGSVRWRVSYGLLESVIDGALGNEELALPGTWRQLEGASGEIEDAEIEEIPKDDD